MRILLDTNVVLDIFAARKDYRRESLALKIMGLSDDAELWVSAKSFTDIFYIMERSKEYGSEAIQDIILENLAYLHVCNVGKEDIVESAKRKWPDFEDCLVALCAEKVNADMLLTRDQKGFGRAKTTVYSPAAFFDWMKREHGIVYDEVEW